jgi:hypothetical protein
MQRRARAESAGEPTMETLKLLSAALKWVTLTLKDHRA